MATEKLDMDYSKYDFKDSTEMYVHLSKKGLTKDTVREKTKKSFPQDVNEQLWGAISAVFLSWNSRRAKTYRKINYIPSDWGTAVNVQAMVFGNMGENCATGVVFTRNPSTGVKEIFGEYLINAQGEDVVAGTRTPQNLLTMDKPMPKIFQQLKKIFKQLEKKYKDMQDIEFTVENNKLWMLQTRSGKRTAKAAIKIAVDMVKEKLISNKEAVLRIDPNTLDTLLHPTLDEKADKKVIASGLPASPGAASGKVTFSADEAVRLKEQIQDTILVRTETSPEDINGMHAAKGILTARGGMTSHAAVIARGMGKPCVSGSSEIKIDYENKLFKSGNYVIKAGEIITIDGGSGKVMLGKVPTVKPDMSGDFLKLMNWADQYRKLKVRTNSETPADTKTARDFGAEGIGLCRTEHMFFNERRIISVRQMILSKTSEDREKALAKLLPYQKSDFFEIFKIMNGLPVTVRLLDPPLHEFLPKTEKDINGKYIKLVEEEIKKNKNQTKIKPFAEKLDEYLISEIVIKNVESDKLDSEIEKLKNKIENEGFENVAKELSISESGIKGGDLGWINENIISEKIKTALINTPIGNLSSPLFCLVGF